MTRLPQTWVIIITETPKIQNGYHLVQFVHIQTKGSHNYFYILIISNAFIDLKNYELNGVISFGQKILLV